MNKKKLLFLVVVTIFSIFFFQNKTVFASPENVSTVTSTQLIPTEDEYEHNISKVVPITPNNLISKFNSGNTFVLFIGYKECRYCRKFSSTLKQFMDTSSTPVFYLDLDSVTENQLSREFLTIINNDIALQGTPTIVLIKHSKVIHKYFGSQTTLNQLQTLNKYKY